MKHLLIFLSCSLLVGCSAPVRLARIGAKHPISAARFCGERFPTKDSVSVRTEYVRGVDSVRVDTVTVDCASYFPENVSQPVLTNKYVRVPCPPCITRVDTVTTISFRSQESTAKLTVALSERDDARKDAVKQNTKMKMWRSIAIVFGVFSLIVAVIFGIKIFK